MRRVIRTLFSIIFIVCGIGVGIFSFTLFPQPFDWGKAIFSFGPILLSAIALVAVGYGVIVGMTWRDLWDSLSYFWH